MIKKEDGATTKAVVVSQTRQSFDRVPLFGTLEAKPLGVRALFFGGIASILICGSILGLLSLGTIQSVVYAGHFQPSPGSPDTIPAQPATITISWQPERPVSGSTVVITVRVTSEAKPLPVGKVRIYDGATVLNTSDLQDGTVTATRKLPYTPKHLIRATYLGDIYHYAVSSVAAK